MLRKTSAVTFMLVMTLLITLKHPVLGYCFCVNSYITDDCCEVIVIEEQAPACADCCTESKTTAQAEPEKNQPCDDCTKRLNLDVSDFVWGATAQLPDLDQHDFPVPSAYSTDFDLFAAQTAVFANGPIRGDPPPWISADLDVSQGRPIYLRHSVLIL